MGEIAKEIEDSDEIGSCVFDIQRSISQQIGTTPVPGAPQNTSFGATLLNFVPFGIVLRAS